MLNQKYHRALLAVSLLILLAFFCYFRLLPIFYQTVPYTYDQGRDFLKAEEIARFKNPTFIGPTTGIMGVYHGAWWFYYLALAYALFNGLPQGFYVAVFLLTFVSSVLFFVFLKKEINIVMAALFALIVTVSPYFIGISFFASNNILTPAFVLLFLYASYMFIKTQKDSFLFLTALSLGFIFESEVVFGLFIIPAFFLSSLFIEEFRKAYLNIRKWLFLLGGLLPFIPRLLFELKNHFLQSQAVLHFLTHPSEYNPQRFSGVVVERTQLFFNYLVKIFYNNNSLLALFFVALAVGAIILEYKKSPKHIKKTLLFLSLVSVLIFALSLLYKNNFFWDYYLEGIPYIFLFMMLLCLNMFLRNKNSAKIISFLIILYAGLNIYFFYHEVNVNSHRSPPLIGLRADDTTVKYIYSQVKNNNFCARIYTPPVIPYTYNYLFHYYAMKNKFNTPLTDYQNNKCYYIIDNDQYPFRIVNWRKENIPPQAKLIQKKQINKQTTVELWSL